MKLSNVAARTLAFTLALAPAGAAVMTVAPTVAHADATGDKVLAKVDAQANAFDDMSYVSTMDIYKNGTKKKTLQFDMVMKGLDKQYINFTAPGDVAGMKVLMNGPEELWMYSPEFKKVRKIAAHAQAQGFFGSDFSAEDMVLAKLSGAFNGKISGKSGSVTTLELVPKEEGKVSVSKMEIDIDSKVGGVTKLRYYDGSGNLARVQTRGGWKKVEGKPFPTQITMENPKAGSKTVIKLSDIKVNSGVEDSLFSRRTLLR